MGSRSIKIRRIRMAFRRVDDGGNTFQWITIKLLMRSSFRDAMRDEMKKNIKLAWVPTRNDSSLCCFETEIITKSWILTFLLPSRIYILSDDFNDLTSLSSFITLSFIFRFFFILYKMIRWMVVRVARVRSPDWYVLTS